MSSRAKTKPGARPRKPKEKAAPAKAKEETVVEQKPVEAARPKGDAPRAIVSSRHERGMIEREARGFSIGELRGAGFSLHDASRLGLSTDIRRRTALERNVESLRSWFAPSKPAPSPKPTVEKAAAEPPPKPKKRAPPKKAKK